MGSPPPAPPPDARALRARLVPWYRAARRDLPWRDTRDAYRVWISEAMLQQTRVETAVDYWRRFVARFPTMADLAAAGEDEVLALWSGLGYYDRARKLRAAARAIVERHGGRFPAERAAALELPGVGPYTAGAVLSIAHDLSEALVDGNVARVLCRLFGIEGDPARAPAKGRLWELARALVPREGGAGEWNQALMELGALVCTPRAPHCADCPLARDCVALRDGLVDELPRARGPRAPIAVELTVLLARRDGRWLLERRPAGGRMAGLLQFPTCELSRSAGAPGELFPRACHGLVRGRELGRISHAITHHRIRARVFAARARSGAARDGRTWRRRSELSALGLTGMARKILRAGLLER